MDDRCSVEEFNEACIRLGNAACKVAEEMRKGIGNVAIKIGKVYMDYEGKKMDEKAVLTNLKNWNFECSNYPMRQDEAEVVIKALEKVAEIKSMEGRECTDGSN